MLNLNLNKKPSETRIVVAMSGGVDSSVTAALMKELGYDVVGITLQLYDLGVDLAKKGACCAGKDIYDAKNVADKINIPHYVLNYESLFKESVIDDFVESYVRGETPIPCVKCNQTVKFRDLYKMAKDLGAEALVTGHYAQKIIGVDGPELHRGVDHSKDQSYFLFATTKDQLDFIHFPLGGMSKVQTRELAHKYNLPTADKPDSQDICFVPNGKYTDVIEKYKPGALDPGEVVDYQGKLLGYHSGVINFTLGQRRGLGVSSAEPLYVYKIEPETKRVFVGPESCLENSSFVIKDVNWLGDTNSKEIIAKVKTRYRQDSVDAKIIRNNGGSAQIILFEPVKAVTPGQACVIYDGERLLGGGWITREIL
jgi:tRNA-specific 2-thiouridylase